jgi:hypothetical protein
MADSTPSLALDEQRIENDSAKALADRQNN